MSKTLARVILVIVAVGIFGILPISAGLLFEWLLVVGIATFIIGFVYGVNYLVGKAFPDN